MVWIHDWPAGMVIASDPPMEVRCDGVGSGGRASRLPEPAMQRNARGEPTALSAVSSESTRRASPDTETLTAGWSLWRRAMLVAALCAVAALTVGVPGAVARGVLDQTSLPALNEGLSVNDAFEHAQTFTAMRTGFLDTVALSFDQSDQDGRYIVDVVPTDAGGLPAGAPLASRTIDACRVQSSPLEIPFGPAASITAGTRYAIVVASQAGSTPTPSLVWDAGSPYAGGAAFSASPPAQTRRGTPRRSTTSRSRPMSRPPRLRLSPATLPRRPCLRARTRRRPAPSRSPRR